MFVGVLNPSHLATLHENSILIVYVDDQFFIIFIVLVAVIVLVTFQNNILLLLLGFISQLKKLHNRNHRKANLTGKLFVEC